MCHVVKINQKTEQGALVPALAGLFLGLFLLAPPWALPLLHWVFSGRWFLISLRLVARSSASPQVLAEVWNSFT